MAKIIKVDPSAIDKSLMREAADMLEQGGLVAFPTETVYGIAVNLLNAQAVKRLQDVKKRPQDKQFTIHIAHKEDAEKYAVDILPRAYRVMNWFWPGPLTVVLNAPEGKTVGLRMPNNAVALDLLSCVDLPVIAPSANLPGHPAALDAPEVFKQLDGLIDLIVDGGPSELGVESTVLDARALPFKILREGYLKEDEIMKVAAKKTVLFVCTGNSCRSVMAEYLLKKKMQEIFRSDVDVYSAGTFAFLGMGPSRETQKLIGGIGLDASSHRARKVNADLVKEADIILVMERFHKQDILRQFPEAYKRVHILGELVGFNAFESDIPDPIGKSEDYYWKVFEKIREAIERLGPLL